MWVNGKRTNTAKLDRGLQFGDGHFTTLTIEHGHTRWWHAHWLRLSKASQKLGIALPAEQDVLAVIRTIASEQPDCVVKIIITRGEGGRGYDWPVDALCNWYVTTAELPQRSQKPLLTAVAEQQLACSKPFAGLKTLNRLEQVMLSKERADRGVDELIVCNTEGIVVETVSSNLFWRSNHHWFTPWLDSCGVAGVARGQILASQLLGRVQECVASMDELYAADQAFICNSVLGLRPLAQIGEHKLQHTQIPEALNPWWQASND